MKRVFKIVVWMVLVALLTQQYAPMAYATDLATEAENEIVLLDRYCADYYEMVAYKKNDMFYVITFLHDGHIELAFAEEGGQARTLWINSEDLLLANDITMKSINPNSEKGIHAIIDYGMNNQNQSVVVDVKVNNYMLIEDETVTVGNVQTRGTGTDDYNSLINQLEAIHGPEHINYDWTGIASNVLGMLTYNYKQALSYDMIYRDSFAFNVGTTLGGLVATIMAFLPGMAVPMAVIATVLGVAALTNTILEHSGAIASYYGSAVYCRYVLVNGGGPYFECFKTTNYNGWVEEGNYYSATLEDLGTTYSLTQEIFESYVIQRTRARENYE